MTDAKIPSVHRAMLVASLAATITFFALPVSIALVAALGSSDAGIAIGFTGLIAVAFGPWIFLASYLGAAIAVLGARARGVNLQRVMLRTHQALGVGIAACMTLVGALLSNEVEPLWLLFTLPAGFVAGSVFSRRMRVTD